ncbi:MAG: SDR family oxidoreductase [Rhizobiaceae bacterium]
MSELFIFGIGFSAKAVADAASSHFSRISGTARSSEKVQAIQARGYDGCMFDGSTISEEIRERLATATHVLMSIAPGIADPVLANLSDGLSASCPKLEWIGYLSTVGVYGNHDGAWVDEDTAPRPVSERSIQRIEAENSWNVIAQKAGVPLAIFRLAGIYGPGRNTFVNIEKGKSRRLVKPGQVFNRIHCEDIGTAVFSAIRSNIGGIFNVTDNEPAPPQDVVAYAHGLMGKAAPPEIDFDTADITPMTRSFYGENKRVSNAKSKAMLGMTYDWPDYRTSLKRMWDEGSWR